MLTANLPESRTTKEIGLWARLWAHLLRVILILLFELERPAVGGPITWLGSWMIEREAETGRYRDTERQ